jgi:hypothetical protein
MDMDLARRIVPVVLRTSDHHCEQPVLVMQRMGTLCNLADMEDCLVCSPLLCLPFLIRIAVRVPSLHSAPAPPPCGIISLVIVRASCVDGTSTSGYDCQVLVPEQRTSAVALTLTVGGGGGLCFCVPHARLPRYPVDP